MCMGVFLVCICDVCRMIYKRPKEGIGSPRNEVTDVTDVRGSGSRTFWE